MGRSLWRAAAIGTLLAGAFSHAGAGTTTVPGEILVKLTRSDAITPLLTKYSLTLKDRFGARPIFRLGTSPQADVQAILASLALEPTVELAEENFVNGSPEARKNLVWAIGTPQQFLTQWALPGLHLPEAWRVSIGAGVRVAVLDTGVDARHPLLAGSILPGYDFVDGDLDPAEVGTTSDLGFGHGTHVAGILRTTAPGVRIMPLRVLDPQGMGNTWVLSEAILYAMDPDGNPATDDGAKVINLSLGTPVRTRILREVARLASCAFVGAAVTEPADDVSDPGYNDDKARCAVSHGAVIVAAAGNSASTTKEYPAAEGVDGLLSVAASNQNQQLASFSNFGSWIDLAAPGDGITSSVPGGGFATWGGTSMAAPWVSGAAALLIANDPTLSPRDVVRRLQSTAAPLCDGSGLSRLDPLAALLNTDPAPLVCP